MALIKVNNRGQSSDFSVERGATKNLIINGSMRIAQRGTSQTNSGVNSIDRYNWALSGATGTYSQQSTTTAERETIGFNKFARMDITTANNNAGFYYIIEANDLTHCHGKKMTLSFYARGTNPAGGNFTFNHYWYDGSNSQADSGVTQNFTLTDASNFQRYSITFDLATASNVDVTTNTARYDVAILQPAADTSTTAWQMDFTGMQLEVGETATDYEHISFAQELRRCERYFATTYPHGVVPGTQANASDGHLNIEEDNGAGGRYPTGPIRFPVEMRRAPDMVLYPGRTGVSATANYVSQYNGNNITGVSNVYSKSHGMSSYIQTSASNYQQISMNYTANAEF